MPLIVVGPSDLAVFPQLGNSLGARGMLQQNAGTQLGPQSYSLIPFPPIGREAR